MFKESKEYAFKLVMAFAYRIRLDQLICPMAGWREDLLAMVCGYMLSPVSNLLKNCRQPNTDLNIIFDDLRSREDTIQTDLAEKHLVDRRAILLDLENSDCIGGMEQVRIGLITNEDGCPCGIELLPKDFGKLLSVDSGRRMSAVVESITQKYKLKSLKFVSKNITPKGVIVTTIFKHIHQTESETPPPATGAYRQFSQAVNFFRNLALQNGLNDFFRGYLFIGLLSYYLQWQMNEALQVYLRKNENSANRHWTLSSILERLKAIKSQKIQLDAAPDFELTDLDDEQAEIISAFGFTKEQLFTSCVAR